MDLDFLWIGSGLEADGKGVENGFALDSLGFPTRVKARVKHQESWFFLVSGP